jgi:Xaa-Pro aminopeptidase
MLNPLQKVQNSLRRKKIDSLLVTQPENRRYLSGYTGGDMSIAESAGMLLIPARGTPKLITDSRYFLQAEAEAAGFDLVLCRTTFLSSLQKILSQQNLHSMAFESHYLLHASYLQFQKMGQKLQVKIVPTLGLVEKMRLQKTNQEIRSIQKAVLLNEEVFQEIFATLKPGLTERQVARQIEATMKEKGADGAAFETIVASGPNGALPHAVPTDREIRKGETLIIDMGLKLDGYCSDMTRTVVLGKPDKRTVKIFRLVRKAQLAAQKKIKAGVTARQADMAARQIIEQAGYGTNFGHSLGHGVGLAVHEAPSLNKRKRNKLRPGMVVTVEPGIYIPGWGGVRLENMVVVNNSNCTLLNKDTTFLDL